MPKEANDDFVGHIQIDRRYEVYASFYDHPWSRRFLELTRATRLNAASFSLCMSWKAIANTHRFPWLMIELLKSHTSGFLSVDVPLGLAISRGIENRLLQMMGTGLSKHARLRLRESVREIAADAASARDDANTRWAANVDLHWSELIEDREFATTIWGTQRICYGALYHAFEDYVRQCLNLAEGLHEDWRPAGDLVAAAKRVLGDAFFSACLGDHVVSVARLVRNSLAHHGGRVTKELQNIQHGIVVEDGVLQIMAEDTAGLFHILKGRAYDVTARVLTLPNLSA